MDSRKYSENCPPVSLTNVDTQGSWWKVFLQVDESQWNGDDIARKGLRGHLEKNY